MRRIPELQALSREHHGALRLALDARRAAESGDPARIAELSAHVRALQARELEPHFRIEERRLLPLLAEAGCEGLVARTLAEHRVLRELAAGLVEPDARRLHSFAELLQAHARFEERELFEAAQARIAPDQLAALLGRAA